MLSMLSESNQVLPIHSPSPEANDQPVADRVRSRFEASGYLQLRRIEVYFHHGRVVLQGQLPTYFLKQMAQSLAASVEGVREVDNDVAVLSRK